MKVKAIAVNRAESRHRPAGTIEVVYEATMPSGKKGTIVWFYEYDKRDVMTETLHASQDIADEVTAFLGDDSPMAFLEAPEASTDTSGDEWNDLLAEADVRVFGYA